MENSTFLKLNINDDNYSLSDYMIIHQNFGTRPNKLVIHDTFSGEAFHNLIKSERGSNILTELIPSEDHYLINERVLLQLEDDIWISYVIIDKESDSPIINDVCFFYKSEKSSTQINQIVSDLCECVVDYEKSSYNKFNTISFSPSSIEIEPIYINTDNIEIEDRYNSSIIKDSGKLVKKMKKTSKGLSIFCGDRGLGKTTLAKWLASKLDRLAIFIPNNMIDLTINNPDFKNFLIKFDKALIIIDDCEFITNNQFSKSSFSNNINQLVDGFLADSFNVQVLLIFNENYDDIDSSIKDTNSLIDYIEFDELTSSEATDLSKNLGFNRKYKDSARLIDVIKNELDEKSIKIGL